MGVGVGLPGAVVGVVGRVGVERGQPPWDGQKARSTSAGRPFRTSGVSETPFARWVASVLFPEAGSTAIAISIGTTPLVRPSAVPLGSFAPLPPQADRPGDGRPQGRIVALRCLGGRLDGPGLPWGDGETGLGQLGSG